MKKYQFLIFFWGGDNNKQWKSHSLNYLIMLLHLLKEMLISLYMLSEHLTTKLKERLIYSVVSNISRGRSKMNDGRSFWTASSECVNMGHDVMSVFLLLRGCELKVDVFEIVLHLWDLLICDCESQGLKPKVTNTILILWREYHLKINGFLSFFF